MVKNKRIFIITIDTEGDNQWDKDKGITTYNSKYLSKFQELAEKYKFKPVWLTNYEMANDDYFVNYMKPKQQKGLCEIGMHLHAWNNPPEYKLNKINKERDYLIEYPEDIMEKKIVVLTELLTKKFDIKPVTHRSGRWATNKKYFELLEKNGYLVDCSVTPKINWEKTIGSTGIGGSNYENESIYPHYIGNKLLEVPMTIRTIYNFQFDRIKKIKNILGETKRLIFGRNQWMRPDSYINKSGLKKIVDICNKNNEYIMFMLHSSELMPGGSPNFKTKNDIENLYKVIEFVFDYAAKKGYVGMTLREFYNNFNNNYEK